MRNDFAIFITSHGRPDICESLDTILRAGYTGEWYIVLDDLDNCRDMYLDTYGKEHICIFNKMYYVQTVDIGTYTTNPPLAAVLYARCAVEDMAKRMRLKHFIVMDDDIQNLRFRYPEGTSCKSIYITKNFDSIIDSYIEFMDVSKATCLSFSNNFLFIGSSTIFSSGKSFKRRSCHNLFFRNTDIECNWTFAMNEDYITALRLGNIGQLFLVPPYVQEDVRQMNNYAEQPGGMSEFYKQTTSFQRAFYSTVACPWACKPRLYNGVYVISVSKKSAYPQIISSSYKK